MECLSERARSGEERGPSQRRQRCTHTHQPRPLCPDAAAGRYGQPEEVAGLVRFLALDPGE